MAVSSSNSFRNASDLKVLNTLRQAHNFSPEMVAEARAVAQERGLSTSGTANTRGTNRNSGGNSTRGVMKAQALAKLRAGQSANVVMSELMTSGLSANEAEQVIREIANDARNQAQRQQAADSEMSPVGVILTILAIILFFIKLAVAFS